MIKVPYEILHYDYKGDTLGSIENIKAESSDNIWEAKTTRVGITLTFSRSTIHEIRLGLLSSVRLTIIAVDETDIDNETIMLENEESTQTLAVHRLKCVNDKVRNNQYPAHLFSRLKFAIENLADWLPMKVAFISIYALNSISLPISPPSTLPLKRPSTVLNSVSNSPKRPKAIASSSPELTTLKSHSSNSVQRRPILETRPAECSYSALLSDCVISSVDQSEHVKLLCECMGACYLNQLADYTTHVVFSQDLAPELTQLRQKDVKVITVQWLEGCLTALARVSEEDFLIH